MLTSEKILILFIFTIIIFIALHYINHKSYSYELTIIITIISSVLLSHYISRDEKFHIDPDDLSLSKYDNISISEDVDMTQQELPGLKLNGKKIDNADVIEEAITRGTTLFQPDGKGFTSLDGNPYSLNISEPFSRYDIPLSGQQNVDDMLARKQAQRGIMNKRAIDGSVRATKDLYKKYFVEEMQENEDRVWYSDEAAPIENDWASYN